MRIHEEQIRVPLPAHYDRLLSHIAAHLSENLPAGRDFYGLSATCHHHGLGQRLWAPGLIALGSKFPEIISLIAALPAVLFC